MIGRASDKDTFDKEGVMKNDMMTYIQLNSIYSMQLNRSISNLRAADTIMSRLNLVHGNLSKVLLHMRLKQLRQGQTSAI